jgi:hypothetical protein
VSRVSFDCTGTDVDEGAWARILKQIDTQLKDAGLPSLYSDRWDEEEGGCVFEGGEREVQAVREILSQYPVRIY